MLLLRRAELAEEAARIDRALAELETDHVSGYSTYRLPTDAKNQGAFNRACRDGRVVGATKLGRVWVCSVEAWEARSPARVSCTRQPELTTEPDDSSLLDEFGLRRTA